MLKHKALAASVAVAGSLALAGAATAAPPIDTSPLRDAVTVDGITEHLAALEAIAERQPVRGHPDAGDRHPGPRGVRRLRGGQDGGCRLRRLVCSRSRPTSSSSRPRPRSSGSRPNPTVYPATTARTGSGTPPSFSGDGDVTAEAVAVDFTEPTTTASASDSGCEAADFDGSDVVGQDRAAAARHLRLRTQGRDRAARPARSAP